MTIEALDHYAWTGHAVLLGNRALPEQDTDFVPRRLDCSRVPAPVREPMQVIARLCSRVGAKLRVRPEEIASRSLRRRALAARAVVADISVCHYGLPLAVVGRALGLSSQSIARAVSRAESAYTCYGLALEDFTNPL